MADPTRLAQELAGTGRIAEAFALLQSATQQGNPHAAALLADWRLSGNFIRRDLSMARSLYKRAAELGLDEAEPIYIALLAVGPGGIGRHWKDAVELLLKRASRDPLARNQASVLERMKLKCNGDPASVPQGEELHGSPQVRRFEQFLTPEECTYLVERALPFLQASVVVHPTTGTLVQDPIRTSKAAAFPFIREDPVIHAINRRIAAASGTSSEQGEPVQVLSYDPGQEYKLHSDALPPGQNQRILTFLVYLNEDYQGGETHFPDLGLTHRGKTGDAVLFANVDAAGEPDQRSRHSGLPVRRGRKMLLSKWIRSAPLDLSGPPGRPF